MRLGFGLVAAFAALALTVLPAQAQIQLTETEPPDGAQLDAPPEVIHVCFSQPVNFDDVTSWRFGLKMPDGTFRGLRTEFKIDGTCANVHPGLPQERPAGEYTFEWHVTAAEGGEEGSGSLRYQVTRASVASPTPAPTAAPTVGPGGGGQEDGGPDILLIALLTTATGGAAAVLLTLGYLLRRRIGYEPHRPPADGDEGDQH